ncbi:MAG TPA: aminoacyl-tRNA hydrolase [Anaerolineae bacterium]|nr:aminoacyl-tRNA hydrolase [Anaerolineae bacterium]
MLLLDKLRGKSTIEPSAPTALVVGLGNPGREYAGSRHNIGWRAADRFVAAHGWRFTKKQNDALVALGQIGGARTIVAKPQTFMNLSGRAVQPLAHFYKAPLDRLLVIFDDIDLPFGTIRLREKGGAGGHNGMRSIIERLGSDDFPRLRIGVGRPSGRMDPAAYVLRDFDPVEQAELDSLLDRAGQAIETFVAEGIGAAMNTYNSPARNVLE